MNNLEREIEDFITTIRDYTKRRPEKTENVITTLRSFSELFKMS